MYMHSGSCYDIPQQSYGSHGAPIVDSTGTSFKVTNVQGSLSDTVKFGSRYNITLVFPRPRHALVTASVGVLSYMNQITPGFRDCPNRLIYGPAAGFNAKRAFKMWLTVPDSVVASSVVITVVSANNEVSPYLISRLTLPLKQSDMPQQATTRSQSIPRRGTPGRQPPPQEQPKAQTYDPQQIKEDVISDALKRWEQQQYSEPVAAAVAPAPSVAAAVSLPAIPSMPTADDPLQQTVQMLSEALQRLKHKEEQQGPQPPSAPPGIVSLAQNFVQAKADLIANSIRQLHKPLFISAMLLESGELTAQPPAEDLGGV